MKIKHLLYLSLSISCLLLLFIILFSVQLQTSLLEIASLGEQHIEESFKEGLASAKATASSQFTLILLCAGLLILLLFTFVILMHRKVLFGLHQLSQSSSKIAAGDFTLSLPAHSNDEVGILGQTFQKTLSQLTEQLDSLTNTKSQMESELNVAKDIQMSMVPLTFPAYPDNPEFDLFAHLIPAREVGGDFYDFYFIDKDHLCFVMADVSGKGVPAALMMAVCRTLLKARPRTTCLQPVL